MRGKVANYLLSLLKNTSNYPTRHDSFLEYIFYATQSSVILDQLFGHKQAHILTLKHETSRIEEKNK